MGLRALSIVALGIIGGLGAAASGLTLEPIFADGFETPPCLGWSTSAGLPDACTLAFRIETPPIEVPPSSAFTTCYYFRTATTDSTAIRRWRAVLSPGVHHAILFATHDANGNPMDKMPPGTVSSTDCGLTFGGGVESSWLHAAHAPVSDLVLPSKVAAAPLAMELPAQAAGFLLLRLLNSTTEPMTAAVVVDAGHDPGNPHVRTDTYLTYNGDISIPPFSTGHPAVKTCPVPAEATFWRLTMRTHQHATLAEIADGAAVVFSFTDWEQPGSTMFPPPGFTFATNQLTYRCTYDNPTNQTITSGTDTDTDEVCIGVGYFFPATRPRLCFNQILIP